MLNSKRSPPRSANCPEVYHEGHGSSAADRPAALLCHSNVRHHRPGVLQRETAQHLRTTPGNSGYSRAPSVCGFGMWGRAASYMQNHYVCRLKYVHLDVKLTKIHIFISVVSLLQLILTLSWVDFMCRKDLRFFFRCNYNWKKLI